MVNLQPNLPCHIRKLHGKLQPNYYVTYRNCMPINFQQNILIQVRLGQKFYAPQV